MPTAPGGPRVRLNITKFQLAINAALGQHDPKWKQADLARYLNIDPAVLSDVMANDVIPAAKVLFALLAWLRLDPSLLTPDDVRGEIPAAEPEPEPVAA